jgi:transcriptional regulator with PAS, ATPase and Fis domain
MINNVKGDIKNLADGFTSMFSGLRETIKAVKMNSEQVASSAEELSSSAEEVNASVEQTSSTIQQISEGASIAANQSNTVLDETKKATEDDNKVMMTKEPIIDHIEKLTTNDGGEKWLSVTKLPWYDDKGIIIGTMGISRDVTKRIKGEKETEKYKKVAIGQNLRMIELRDKVKDIIQEIEDQDTNK